MLRPGGSSTGDRNRDMRRRPRSQVHTQEHVAAASLPLATVRPYSELHQGNDDIASAEFSAAQHERDIQDALRDMSDGSDVEFDDDDMIPLPQHPASPGLVRLAGTRSPAESGRQAGSGGSHQATTYSASSAAAPAAALQHDPPAAQPTVSAPRLTVGMRVEVSRPSSKKTGEGCRRSESLRTPRHARTACKPTPQSAKVHYASSDDDEDQSSPANKLKKEGFVRFIGETKFARGVWVGVEMYRKGDGRNDGSVNGVRYFTTNTERGVFVRTHNVVPIDPAQLRPAVLTHSPMVGTMTTPKLQGGDMSHQPAGLSHQPAGMSHQPAGMSHQPAGMSHQPAGDSAGTREQRDLHQHTPQASLPLQTSPNAAVEQQEHEDHDCLERFSSRDVEDDWFEKMWEKPALPHSPQHGQAPRRICLDWAFEKVSHRDPKPSIPKDPRSALTVPTTIKSPKRTTRLASQDTSTGSTPHNTPAGVVTANYGNHRWETGTGRRTSTTKSTPTTTHLTDAATSSIVPSITVTPCPSPKQSPTPTPTPRITLTRPKRAYISCMTREVRHFHHPPPREYMICDGYSTDGVGLDLEGPGSSELGRSYQGCRQQCSVDELEFPPEATRDPREKDLEENDQYEGFIPMLPPTKYFPNLLQERLGESSELGELSPVGAVPKRSVGTCPARSVLLAWASDTGVSNSKVVTNTNRSNTEEDSSVGSASFTQQDSADTGDCRNQDDQSQPGFSSLAMFGDQSQPGFSSLAMSGDQSSTLTDTSLPSFVAQQEEAIVKADMASVSQLLRPSPAQRFGVSVAQLRLQYSGGSGDCVPPPLGGKRPGKSSQQDSVAQREFMELEEMCAGMTDRPGRGTGRKPTDSAASGHAGWEQSTPDIVSGYGERSLLDRDRTERAPRRSLLAFGIPPGSRFEVDLVSDTDRSSDLDSPELRPVASHIYSVRYPIASNVTGCNERSLQGTAHATDSSCHDTTSPNLEVDTVTMVTAADGPLLPCNRQYVGPIKHGRRAYSGTDATQVHTDSTSSEPPPVPPVIPERHAASSDDVIAAGGAHVNTGHDMEDDIDPAQNSNHFDSYAIGKLLGMKSGVVYVQGCDGLP